MFDPSPPPPNSPRFLRTKQISPPQMFYYITHKKYIVRVSRLYFVGYAHLWIATKEKTLYKCRTDKFQEVYPEKWQEIQTELALQKLKDA